MISFIFWYLLPSLCVVAALSLTDIYLTRYGRGDFDTFDGAQDGPQIDFVSSSQRSAYEAARGRFERGEIMAHEFEARLDEMLLGRPDPFRESEPNVYAEIYGRRYGGYGVEEGLQIDQVAGSIGSIYNVPTHCFETVRRTDGSEFSIVKTDVGELTNKSWVNTTT